EKVDAVTGVDEKGNEIHYDIVKVRTSPSMIVHWAMQYGGKVEIMDDRMKVLTDIEEDGSNKSMAWWRRLDEVQLEDFDRIYRDIPDGLIFYREMPYILISVNKKKEYSPRWVLDDIEFDVYESGEIMEFEVARCGSDENALRWTIKLKPGQSCLEVFNRHHIRIPDEKERKMYLPLIKRSKILMEKRGKVYGDIIKLE
ncbi:MAG: hypothetical protein K6F44_06465, partial [Lachnospiraceae bacterium]|nr:hypothetical protein [Lachnospiraceae bacterium]